MTWDLRFPDIVRLALHAIECEIHSKGLDKKSDYWLYLNHWRTQLTEVLKEFKDEV